MPQSPRKLPLIEKKSFAMRGKHVLLERFVVAVAAGAAISCNEGSLSIRIVD